MYIRSRAPLRLGFAGGGTDVSPYSDLYGGNILNATINKYAHACIEPRKDGIIEILLPDLQQNCCFDSSKELPLNSLCDLQIAVYNRIIKDFQLEPLSFTLTTTIDAPSGSGLGTSSTLVVATLAAFTQWLNLPLGECEMARLAYEIERLDLSMAGGKQDQYAATFGGFNFMQFYAHDKVIINPLRVKEHVRNELAHNTVLFNTKTNRLSTNIIEQQQQNVKSNVAKSLDAMHRLKQQAQEMKEALLRGELNRIGEILHQGWSDKMQMAKGITTPLFEEVYEAALKHGSTGGKISGAGGGGFIFFYCPNNSRYEVVRALSVYEGKVENFDFVDFGVQSWCINE